MNAKQAEDQYPNCQQRVQENYEGRIEDLRKLWAAYCEGNEDRVEDLGNIFDYGLCFDYVAPDTFGDQPEGYFRYQFSWGGPSDELRIYAEQIREYHWSVYKIEYWFMDWFDGAHINPQGDDQKFIKKLFEGLFVESGTADSVHAKAMEDWTPTIHGFVLEDNEDEE